MLTISGIVATVSVFVVVIVSAVLIKQKYDVEKDYNGRINNLTKQVNDANVTKAEYDSKQQKNIQGIETDYVKKADQSKNTKTEVLDAKTATFNTASSENGLQITKDNPGALVEKVYNKDQGDRYGVGNFGNTSKVYASSVNNDAKINLSFANKDGSFQDAVTLQRKGDKDSLMNLKGNLILNDKYMLNGSKDDYIQLMNKEGMAPAGGIAMNSLKVDKDAKLKMADIGMMGAEIGAIKDAYMINSSADKGNFGSLQVAKNADVKGKLTSTGDATLGGKLNFGAATQNPQVYMERTAKGLSLHFDGPAPAPFLSQRYYSGTDIVHELDTKGVATHRGMKLANNTKANNIVLEAGRTMDDKNEGMSAINFNGMTNGKDVLLNEEKSRWRMLVDQRSSSDSMSFDQTMPDFKKNTYMTFSNNNVGVGTSNPTSKLNVFGGSFTQKQDAGSGAWTMGSSGGEGILAYDGASFSFGNKGTKMISLNANGTVGMSGNVNIDKSANIAGAVNTPNVWFENTIGLGKSSAGYLGVMDKSKALSTFEAKEVISGKGKIGKAGLDVEGDISGRASLNLDKSAFVKGSANVSGSLTTPNVWLEDNIGLGKTPSGYVGVMDRTKQLSSIEMKNFVSSSGKIGKDGLQIEGSITSKSGLNLEKSATVNGDLYVKGSTTIDGALKLGNESLLMDAQGNLVVAPKAGKSLVLGKPESGLIHLGPTENSDIIIGKNKAFFASKGDGNTYINPYRAQQNVMLGSGEMVPRSVIVGEKASENKIGTESKMNMIGKSMFPSYEGDVVLRPSAQGKRVMIGTDTDVAAVNIGMKGTAVNVNEKLCMQDSCVNSTEFRGIKDISRLAGLPGTKFTTGDVDNVQKRLPPLFNAEALKLTSADIGYISKLPGMSSKPAMGLTEGDIANIRGIPGIAANPSLKLTKGNVDILSSITAQDVTNLKQMPSLPAYRLTKGNVDIVTSIAPQDVTNLKQMPALPAFSLTTQDVQVIKQLAATRGPAPFR